MVPAPTTRLLSRLPHVLLPRFFANLVIGALSFTVVGLPLALRQAVRWAFLEQAVLLDSRSGREALDESASDEARASRDEGPYPRFGMPSPHSVPEHGLCDTSVTFALPLLSRETRKLVQAVLFVVVVSRKLPSGFDVETR
jgi:hypothetical protein